MTPNQWVGAVWHHLTYTLGVWEVPEGGYWWRDGRLALPLRDYVTRRADGRRWSSRRAMQYWSRVGWDAYMADDARREVPA